MASNPELPSLEEHLQRDANMPYTSRSSRYSMRLRNAGLTLRLPNSPFLNRNSSSNLTEPEQRGPRICPYPSPTRPHEQPRAMPGHRPCNGLPTCWPPTFVRIMDLEHDINVLETDLNLRPVRTANYDQIKMALIGYVNGKLIKLKEDKLENLKVMKELKDKETPETHMGRLGLSVSTAEASLLNRILDDKIFTCVQERASAELNPLQLHQQLETNQVYQKVLRNIMTVSASSVNQDPDGTHNTEEPQPDPSNQIQ
ncbi:hypothetical protein QR680_003146 [Steinernema hermaphroditum]|uniref:Uncharacterized protein n=1 Tax=Steinernema hermaphroditum TaxID=289476 RepID=A0AA39H5J9_9BILA|nr:hypothetical protein QR680_003146 [Steinernema hermaphroditum]